MKKYNSFLGAFFSGDNGQGGYNAAYRQGALAKLYTGSLPPEQQQEAVAGLARVDPDAAYKFQQTQQAAQQESLKRKAMLIANAPPAQRGQLYASVLPEIRKDWADAPEQYTPELDSMVTTWAQTVGGAGNKGKYTGAPIIVQTENGPKYARYSDSGIELTQFAPDDRFTMNVDAEGNVRGYNTRRNVLAPTADASAPQPVAQGDDPMAQALERIRMGGEVLASNNGPVDQINAWKDAEFAKAQQQLAANGVQVTQPAPPPARVAVKDQGQITPYQEETLRLQREAATRAESEAAAKAAERKAAADAKAQERQARIESAQATTDNLLDNIRQLKKHPGFKDLGTLGGNVADSALPEYVPTQYRGAKARLETIKGQIALQAMAELKALSNTGATGFGALAVPELTLLQNSIQTLTTSQNNPDIMAALDQIEKLLTKAKSGKQQPPAGGQGKYSVGQVLVINGKRYQVTGGDMNDPDLKELK